MDVQYPPWPFDGPTFAGHSRGRRRAAISLTPLIDVVFILVIFFMLASSFADWRSIDFAATGRGEIGARAEGAVLLEVRSDGLRLSGDRVDLPEAVARLDIIAMERPGTAILVRPGAGVPLQDLVFVLDALAEASIGGVSLISEATP